MVAKYTPTTTAVSAKPSRLTHRVVAVEERSLMAMMT
jgi:hypothetical protein